MSKQSTDTGGGSEHGQPAAHQQPPDFGQAECLTHLGAQFPYTPFDTSLFNERMFRPDAMELHDGSAGIDFGGGHFNMPRPGDEASFQNWASAACGAAMFDHHQQQQHQQQQQPSSAQVSSMSELISITISNYAAENDPFTSAFDLKVLASCPVP
jgi:hypothetical protein